MRSSRLQLFRICLQIVPILFFTIAGFSQTTSLTMTLQHVVQTAPNIFEYDVMLSNTGTTSVALRGYSCGINHAAGMNGTGVLSHTFVSRDASLSTIPTVTAAYTASSNHLRITTLNAAAGNEVVMPFGAMFKLATMRVTNTVNFPANFSPALALQMISSAGKTQCIAACIVTPPGSNYSINSVGNSVIAGTLQALTGVVNTPCFFLNPTAAFAASVTTTTAVNCYGQNTGALQVLLTGTGSAAPSGSSGTYKINGGNDINFTTNPFSIPSLSAGSYTITATTSNGCTDTALAIINQPSGPIASSFNGFICNGSYTLPWGTIVNNAGNYLHTYQTANGCDSVVTANLSSGNSTGNMPTNATACNSYLWSVNNQTYSVTGNYVANFTNAAGCDSSITLNLTINQSTASSSSSTACNSYFWNLSGLTYSTSGTYVYNSTNAQGCQYTQTLLLTIKNSSSSTSTVAVLGTYTWALSGQTYTTSGTYTYTTINAVGCDSIVTLNLTILQVSMLMTMQNAIQTAPNVFEYDVMLTYTGNTTAALRAYSVGINHAAGMNGGGTITHTYVSRDASLSTIPVPTFSYTASSNHIRLTTTSAAAGNEVMLTPGLPVRIATMRIINTVNFPADFNPAFTMQTISAAGKTQCVATCILTPPGTNYSINGVGNSVIAGTLQALTGVVNTPCFFLNPTAVFAASVTTTTAVNCYGQNTGALQVLLTGTGSAAPSGSSGTYKINGGNDINFTTNPFSIPSLSAGSYTITATTSNGCTDTALAIINQPSGPIASSFNGFICNGSYTLPWGTIVNNAGNYLHTYQTANGCDSVVTANLSSGNSTGNMPTNATACNSYLWSVNNQTYSVTGNYVANFTNAAGCDSSITLNLTINQSTASSSSSTACNSYFWNLSGLTYSTSGTYVYNSTNAQGCQYTQTLLLTIKNSSSSTSTVAVLGTYTWALSGQTYTTSGTYTYTTINAVGCDSIVTLNLTILQVSMLMTMQNAIQTAPNVFEYDVMLTYTGNTTAALRAYSVGINHAAGMNGGGTITHTYVSRDASLSTIPVPTFSYTASSNHIRLTTTSAAAGNEVMLTPGLPVRIATMRIINTVNFPADFNPAFTMQTISAAGKTQCVATCILTPPGSNYVMNGIGNLAMAGTLQILTGVVNTPCFYLNPTNPFAAVVSSSTQTLCNGLNNGTAQISVNGTGSISSSSSYTINGGNSIAMSSNPFTIANLSAGTYSISVANSNGCTANTAVTISSASPITASSATTACNSYTWGGTTYTLSGILTHTFTSAAGCDSIHTKTLTLNYSNTGSSNANACNSFLWNGITYTQSATLTHTFTNALGCDSVHTLHLTIVQSNTGSSIVTACNSYVWTGTTYLTSANPTHTYVNAAGCDSVHTLHLILYYSNTGTSSVTSCDQYNWNGSTYTASGIHTHNYTNQSGCDSIHTLNLIIYQSNTGSSSVSACDSYTWLGNIYTATISAIHTFTNIAGCDSVHTLNIDIHHSNTGSSSVSACNSYSWQGNNYVNNANPIYVFTNVSGCDSTHTLHITVHPTTFSTSNVTSVNSYTWLANNTIYTMSGVYAATLLNAAGCDSILTLNLSIITLVVQQDQEISCYGSNDGSASSSATGGSGNFTYDIDGANLFTNLTGFFQGLTPGTHTICAKETPSNLIVCQTLTIIEPDPLNAFFMIDSSVSCAGGGGQLSLLISGGTSVSQPYLTLWTNANGDTLNDQTNDIYAVTLGNLTAGIYNVKIEDDRACILNTSTVLLPPACGDTLHLKLFFQGYFAGSSLMNPVMLNQGESLDALITDSITVELRDAVSPYGLLESQRGILHTDGNSTITFSNIASPCYIVITHRNGLQTWSANPIQFTTPTITYDFTIAANKAYGDNQLEIEPGVWAIYTGDLNYDENIDLLDATEIEMDIQNFVFGYYSTDLNGDGNVDLLDLPIMELNIGNFIFSYHP